MQSPAKTPSRRKVEDIEALKRNAGAATSMLTALANERRLMILCLLIAEGEITVNELSRRVRRVIAALKDIFC